MNVEYVNSQTVLQEELLSEIAKHQILGLDIETRGLNPLKHQIVCIQLYGGDDAWVIDTRKVNIRPLLEVLTATNPLFIGHNLKFDLSFLKINYDFAPKRIFDTMIAYGIRYMGLESPYVSLRALVKEHIGVILDKDMRGSFQLTYGELTDEQINYSALDVRYLQDIFEAQLPVLQERELIRTAQLEFALIPAIIDMELTGITLDVNALETLIERQIKKQSEVELKIGRLLGDVHVQGSFFNEPKLSINLGSPKQVLSAFKKLGVELENTRADTLRKLAHPFAKAMLEYRATSKMITTYGRKFITTHLREDGKIHAQFNQLGTRTGRFSSSKPNLHNIPADVEYRDCFIAGEGNILISADYSQVELKIAAVMSRDTAMLDEYKKINPDLHRRTGSLIYKVALDEVTPFQKGRGKNCNYGTMYGISKYGLYNKFDIPLDEGDELLLGFSRAYPILSYFMQEQSNIGLKQGYTTTKIGRRRYYRRPAIDDIEYGRKIGSIRREASNHKIQGTAAEIMKQSLVYIYEEIKDTDTHLVNTIHDELVVETPADNTSSVVRTVYDCMERAGRDIMGDELKWTISLGFGKTWKHV